MTTFADVLSPITPEEFFADYHGKTPLHIPGTPDKFASVLDRNTLSEIVSQTGLWTGRTVRVIVDNHTLEQSEYCYPGEDRESRPCLIPDPQRVSEWVAYGASVIFNHVSSLTPGLRATVGAVEQGTGGVADNCDVYISSDRARGVATHFDTYDVYALQLEGIKTWNIYQRHYENPVVHEAFKTSHGFDLRHRGQLTHRITLEPGDVLYLPRGWYHDAKTVGPFSLHVTVGIDEPLGIDLMKILIERAVYDPAFRRALPHADDPDLPQHIASLGKRLADFAQESDVLGNVVNLLARYHRRRPSALIPPDDDLVEMRQQVSVEIADPGDHN
jgi:ribosomal protein L16 Arg81 hydroxylase